MIKTSLLTALMIGLVVFSIINVLPTYAQEECGEVQISGGGECTTDEDCDDGNPCTDDKCICTTYCDYTYNNYQEEEPCGTGECAGTRTRTCSEGSFGPWSDCSTYGDVCGECDPGPDCALDEFYYTIDVLVSGGYYCDKDGYCQGECVYEHYCLDNDYKDGGPYTFGCGAECDGYGEECPDYCEGDTLYTGYCDLWPGDCTCDYDSYDCNKDDGCYVYGDGCEERDYFCSEENGVDCDYTYSNRNEDYKEDWVYYCEGDELRKHRKLHDFYCDNDCCKDHADWVDDQLVEDCYYYDTYCEGDELWYEEGYCDPSGPVCDYTTGFLEDCYYYEEFCEGDIRKSDTGYCDCDSCHSTIAEIEDCSDNNYEDCQDTYYKHYYTESCHETDGETQCLPASSLIDCRDEYWCDGQEYCVENTGVHCEDGTPPDCDDEDECTYDNCIEDGDNTGHCENPHKDIYPPETEKWYEGPYKFGSGPEEWINSLTEVWMSAEDQGPESLPQCAVGVDKIWYKDIYLENEEDWHYCSGDCEEWVPNDYEDEGWVEYCDPFHKEPESCHIIEYYSEDKLGNKEVIDWQCVFVDNTPPTPVKEVGEFKVEWDGEDSEYYPDIGDKCWSGDENEIECWTVTTETLISMSCIDPEPHPVGFKELCYRVELDGGDTTGDYCSEDLYEGWCCIDDSTEELVFEEESEHELEFYCVDELDQTSEIDIEKFKVVEVEEFEIELNFKWNLVSVPFVLLNDDPGEVFKDIKEDVLLVLTYDREDPACVANGGWCIYIPKTDVGTIEEIKPGWGYWVLTNDSTSLFVTGILIGTGKWSMPSRSLLAGWNLIGYYGTEGLPGYYGPVGGGREAFCALNSLANLNNVIPTKWNTLITYWDGTLTPLPNGYNRCEDIDPGAGYWIGMIEPESDYIWSGQCPGLEEVCP